MTRRASLLALLLAACPSPSPSAPDACQPATCLDRGANCGTVSDGCGGTLECGTCAAPETCGGAGRANVCGVCTPESDARFCSRSGKDCGNYTALDNCGALRTAQCGSCTQPMTCGGGRVQNVCGSADCPAESDAAICQRYGRVCGVVAGTDRCGRPRTAACSQCAAPDTCGGGGVEGECGCTPESDPELCATIGANCGDVSLVDKCGATRSVNCGTCTEPATCGGSGEAHVCGDGTCGETNAAFCQRLGKSCGPVTGEDNCGVARTVECGACTAPETCGGGGEPGKCGLCSQQETDEQMCVRLGRTCGEVTAPDLCGTPRTLQCGTCADGQVCGGGGTPGTCGCSAETPAALCARLGANCGQVTTTNLCGVPQTVSCGFCPAPKSCGANGTANVCGCVPKTCAALGRTCGKVPDDCGGEVDCGPCANGQTPPPYCIRVVAANITSGNKQSYDPGEGIRIFQGLKPDVVMIQEFNYGSKSEADIRTMVQTAFGSHFWHAREPGDQIPNGVISRFPIVASGEWDDTLSPNRDFVWARIDVPGPKDLWVVSLHLLTSNAGDRGREATALVNYIQNAMPSGDFLVLGGDLNTGSRTETCFSTLGKVVSTASPHPVDQKNNPNTSANRNSPYDWVLASPNLKAYQTATRIGSSSYASGLVFDSRVYTPLSEVAPVLETDSDAANMQHMAVVKDFCLPLQ